MAGANTVRARLAALATAVVVGSLVLAMMVLSGVLPLPGFVKQVVDSAGSTSARASTRPIATVSVDTSRRVAALVADEDRRLTEVRDVSTVFHGKARLNRAPYRVASGAKYSLVLTPRGAAYTVQDLLTLAPQTFQRLSDGSYLLSENLVVLPGARLAFRGIPGGLKLRLASDSTGFVSIVSFGGVLELLGTSGAHVELTSWDAHAGKKDMRLDDGRAYVRAVGGQFAMTYVDASQLGFWSGRTGGISLTGTDRPDTGALVTAPQTKTGLPSSVTVLPSGPVASKGSGGLNGSPLISYASGSITHTVVDGDAYGLFVTGAAGIVISDTKLTNNAFDGLLLHRFVVGGQLDHVETSDNGGNGVTVDRGSEGIQITQSSSLRNGGQGFALSGRALSDGTSPTGASQEVYGNLSISTSTAAGNDSDGIRVIGGFNIGLRDNRVIGSVRGIVVTQGAQDVTISGNHVEAAAQQGIAITDGVTRASVTGNDVQRAATGIYVRESSATLRSNTIESAARHGVTFVGAVGGSRATDNVLAGRGLSSLDRARSSGDLVVEHNADSGWTDTSPLYEKLQHFFQPMTVVWSLILGLVALSAVRARAREAGSVKPYLHRAVPVAPQASEVIVERDRVIDLRDEASPGWTSTYSGFATADDAPLFQVVASERPPLGWGPDGS